MTSSKFNCENSVRREQDDITDMQALQAVASWTQWKTRPVAVTNIENLEINTVQMCMYMCEIKRLFF